jgi:hypothetical protein
MRATQLSQFFTVKGAVLKKCRKCGIGLDQDCVGEKDKSICKYCESVADSLS